MARRIFLALSVGLPQMVTAEGRPDGGHERLQPDVTVKGGPGDRSKANGTFKRRIHVPRFMTRKAILTLGLALVLAAGGIATASNMGFKFVKAYTGGGVTNTLSLPYFQSQFTNFNTLFDDITGATAVCRINLNESRDCWLGNFTGSPVIAINTQDGYTVATSAATTQVLVGSHNPALALTLTGGGQTNFKSIPYHMTYTTSRGIYNDITGATSVCRLNPNESRDCWLGDFTGSPNWVPTIGIGVIIATAANTTWVPDHY